MGKIILPLIIFLLSCDTSRNNILYDFNGTWVACDLIDGGTVRTIFVISNNGIVQSVDTYGTPDCTGTIYSSSYASGTIDFAPLQQSKFEPNATNITLYLNTDLYDCGLGGPAYSYLKIMKDTEFYLAKNPPSCDPANRGSGLGSLFIKAN